MIQTFMRWLPGRTVVFIADGSFSAIELLNLVSELEGASLITRLRLDAALYDRAPVRVPGQNGCPRKKGARRPTLKQVLANSQTEWTKLKLDNWYGAVEREVKVATETAVWYHSDFHRLRFGWC